jgi:hypothetical protein
MLVCVIMTWSRYCPWLRARRAQGNRACSRWEERTYLLSFVTHKWRLSDLREDMMLIASL